MIQTHTPRPELKQVSIDNELYYRIADVDGMRPFFMSIVSDANHWMFIGSNGGLSAGRKNADYPLFPYYTDDKIIEGAEFTGSKSIIAVEDTRQRHVWEPFSVRYSTHYSISRNLFKNLYGNKIIFEEINRDLDLVFRYEWNSSNMFGFVKKSSIRNLGKSQRTIALLDGLQNIMPAGVGDGLQNQSSNLVDAYKRSELDKGSGIGIFGLSAIIVDKAEPSEALKANVVWSTGLGNCKYLLSSRQLESFRHSTSIVEEYDVKGDRGAYFVSKKIQLEAEEERNWMIIADVNKSASAVTSLIYDIKNNSKLENSINEDIEKGTRNLVALNASADALQLTNDAFRDARHYSNALFNIMRGGVFDDNYQIGKEDFLKYMRNANRQVFAHYKTKLESLPASITLFELRNLVDETKDAAFIRLSTEYLPLKFSRRHGDPSRPWNRFSINTHDEHDGSKVLNYEGNWRDIFQNWEALAHSFPEFVEGMMFRFLNASTFDGYNPYRITKNGIDWEKIEPDDPWSYIGYWGDHQIIYLLKFLEFSESYYPGKLAKFFNEALFVYADVPYRIKSYDQLLKNPKDTIDFDHEADAAIEQRRSELGSDGALLRNQGNAIVRVNFVEKILATLLAKMSNFIPEGGIWMNTQRPEWNDANNALVGNGVSVVTLYYLRRFLNFIKLTCEGAGIDKVPVTQELREFLDEVINTLETNQHKLDGMLSDEARQQVLDGLGQAGSKYRLKIYEHAHSGEMQEVQLSDIIKFIDLSISYADHTIKSNRREDNLYHSYNIMAVLDDGISISHLSEMLEGQVAVLSSGFLSSDQALEVLDALRASQLYRADQSSYILYPNRDLPGFLQKNNIPESSVAGSELLSKLVSDGNASIVEKDVEGKFHFNGNFRNGNDVEKALELLAVEGYDTLVRKDRVLVLKAFEEVFNHKAFTGRSGTFYGYEGLGSIYWHMVSKLALATMECCKKAIEEKANKEVVVGLIKHFHEINEGLGLHKSPALYGAFPTDPYSHTPMGKGAQQPGMTGQVKEDLLCRYGELGIEVKDGKLSFNPRMLHKEEFLTEAREFSYINKEFKQDSLMSDAGTLCFTYCQVPIIYTLGSESILEVELQDGSKSEAEDLVLDMELSHEVFKRTGKVVRITATIDEIILFD